MFAQRLAEIRAARGLSQTELAHSAGITQQAVDLLEKGSREPLLRTSRRLAEALDVPHDTLLAVPGSPIPPPAAPEPAGVVLEPAAATVAA